MTSVSSRGVLEASRSWGRLRGGGEEGTAELMANRSQGRLGSPGLGLPGVTGTNKGQATEASLDSLKAQADRLWAGGGGRFWRALP